MRKILIALAVLVALTVAVPVPNVDGHSQDTMFSASTVYASTEGQRIHEHLHGALEECGKKQPRRMICLTCYASGNCQNCGGRGHFVIYDPNGFPMNQTCWRCNGSGRCSVCGGKGGYYYP